MPISDSNGLVIWLKDKPPHWACMIAVRIALRAVPILEYALRSDGESRRAKVVLPSLIALAAASSIGARPERLRDVRQSARAAASRASDAIAAASNESQMNVIHAIEAVPEEILYIHELEADRDAVTIAAHAVAAIVHAMQAASELDDFTAGIASSDAVLDSVISTANEAHRAVDGANGYEEFRATAESDSDAQVELLHISEFWKSVDRDAACLETTAKQSIKSMAIEHLSATALWSQGIPIWASRSWAEFKNALPPAERWEVWTDWYEARLLGRRPDIGQELRWIAVASKEWTAGAAKANAAIESLTDLGESRSTGRTTAMADRNDYQVALSFAGEQRNYVKEVARHLEAKSIAVFYDEFEVAQLWGKDGAETFHQVYSERATYVVMFISEEYVGKRWTRLESRSALSRMLKEEQEFILPVRFDDTPIPGLPDTTLYLSANDYPPAKLAAVIAKKLGIAVFAGKASDVPPPRMPSQVGEAKFDYSVNAEVIFPSCAEVNFPTFSNLIVSF